MKIFFYLFFAFIIGCAEGNCIRKISSEDSKSKSIKEKTIWVYKYDGSRQCGLGEIVSLGKMKSELEDFLVYKMEKRNDGLIRTMNCGAPTGMANVYQIPKKDIEEAIKLGFKTWSFTK